jgi:hypothetical protein
MPNVRQCDETKRLPWRRAECGRCILFGRSELVQDEHDLTEREGQGDEERRDDERRERKRHPQAEAIERRTEPPIASEQNEKRKARHDGRDRERHVGKRVDHAAEHEMLSTENEAADQSHDGVDGDCDGCEKRRPDEGVQCNRFDDRADDGTHVVGRGLTVRQTALLVRELVDAPEGESPAVLARWCDRRPPQRRGHARPVRGVAETLALDVATIRRSAGRLQASLLATPLAALGPAADAFGRDLAELQQVLGSLATTIGAAIEKASDA